jgi:hypothetical protein
MYWNPSNRMTSAVPRHSEIVESVANRSERTWAFPEWAGEA